MNDGKGCAHHDAEAQDKADLEILAGRMKSIRHKIIVLSGKGGVGKSTVAVNMAVSLSLAGKKVGLLDIDIHGPSIPKLLHLEDRKLSGTDEGLNPIEYTRDLKVMSIGFAMLGRDEAVIWRGPMKHGIIKQFLGQTLWGKLDYLIVDSPPGTGDEPLSIAQFLTAEARAVIVTTPQEIALTDVRKSIQFCGKLDLSILGVIENMSGFVCPHCNKTSDIFKSGGGEEMARSMEVPFLGKIPIDPEIVEACDDGKPYVDRFKDSTTAKAFQKVIQPMLDLG